MNVAAAAAAGAVAATVAVAVIAARVAPAAAHASQCPSIVAVRKQHATALGASDAQQAPFSPACVQSADLAREADCRLLC
jgi:hypothetical protein